MAILIVGGTGLATPGVHEVPLPPEQWAPLSTEFGLPEPPCDCIGDLNADCVVDLDDLLTLLGELRSHPGSADLNLDGMSDGRDLTVLLRHWGDCDAPRTAEDRLTLITLRAAEAYAWSLPLNWSYRFQRRSKLIYAPPNRMYAAHLAAWNTGNYYAANASTVYASAALSLEGRTLVYTVPPTILEGEAGPAGDHGVYNSTQLYDVFLNSIADPGTRTTGNDSEYTHFLIVGPDSDYAKKQQVTIAGQEFPVIALDTNEGVLLARVLAHTLAPAADPMSTTRIQTDVLDKIALNTLEDSSRTICSQSITRTWM
jgi:hypothetical protein